MQSNKAVVVSCFFIGCGQCPERKYVMKWAEILRTCMLMVNGSGQITLQTDCELRCLNAFQSNVLLKRAN